jgi:hypothetical protein
VSPNSLFTELLLTLFVVILGIRGLTFIFLMITMSWLGVYTALDGIGEVLKELKKEEK